MFLCEAMPDQCGTCKEKSLQLSSLHRIVCVCVFSATYE